MQNSPIAGNPVSVLIHIQPALVEQTKTPDGKHAVQVPAEPIRAAASSLAHPTPLSERSVTIIETTTSSKLDRKLLPPTAREFENLPVQNKNTATQIKNEVKVSNFIAQFNAGHLTTVEKLRNYLAQESIDLNDPLFHDNFSNLNFTKISLSLTKVLVDFNLNLNTNEYTLLIIEKLNALIKSITNEFSRNINFILNSSDLLIDVNAIDAENAIDIMETIKFFASQTSSDEIRNIAAAIKSKTYQKDFLAAFDAGRKERWDRTQGLHEALKVCFPTVISTLITDYINESPDKDSKRPPDTPDSSGCCVIL